MHHGMYRLPARPVTLPAPYPWPMTRRQHERAHTLAGHRLFELRTWLKSREAGAGVPDGWFLHVETGKRYGRYRDGTGTVDGTLLQQAMAEVQASDLDGGTKERVLARARAIGLQHGLSHLAR